MKKLCSVLLAVLFSTASIAAPVTSVNVGGTWHTVTAPSAHASSAWHDVQEIDAKVSGTWQVVFQACTNVTHTYTSGSSTESVANGSGTVVITIVGGGADGGGGYFDGIDTYGGGGGGGAGGHSIKTISLASADKGVSLSYAVGADLGDSTVSGTVVAGSVSMTANHGLIGHDATNSLGGTGNAGGSASGGDTNVSGNAGGDGSGGVGSGNGGFGGIGYSGYGDGGTGSSGIGAPDSGQPGVVIFAYTC